MTLLHQFQYYNAPDGQKPIEKIIATTKWGFVFGTSCGIAESCFREAPKTPMSVLNCVGHYAVPITAMCAAFSLTTYAATNIRGKDVPGNHAIGAFAAAGIFYKWTRNPIAALNWGVLVAVLAASLKHSRQIGFNLYLDTPNLVSNDGLFADHDYTLVKDPRPWKN